jgi:hypothetical protein
LDVDCTCPYSPYSLYGDVAGPYHPYNDVASDDVAGSDWLLEVNDVMTRVWLVASNMRTRGPIPGHHVSPSFVYLVV